MADVASCAGVSTMTVSRALKGDAKVAEDTRRRIDVAVENLGYVLDRSASSFLSRRSGFVAALVPSLNNSNFADTARGLSEALAGSGRQLLLGYTDYSVEQEEKILRSMLMRRPEAVVVTGGRHTERARRLLVNSGVPVVETWDLPEQPVGHVVGFSNAAAIRTLVHHLHGKGYRRIAYIGGTSNRDTRGADRRRGYVTAIGELCLGQPRIISFGQPPTSMAQGGEAIAQLLAEWPDTDAAVCVSDISAFGALMECHRRGWRVPDRVALAGFGDFEVSRASSPRLTTVFVDAHRIGYEAGNLLTASIEARYAGQRSPRTLTTIPFEVIERETT